MTYSNLLPCLDLLDSLAHLLEQLARLLDELVDSFPHSRGVAPGSEVADFSAEALVVAVELEELVHKILGEAREFRVVSVGAAADAAATGLASVPCFEGRELIE